MEEKTMTKSMIGPFLLALGLACSAIGCGDDEGSEEDDVNIETPGADVSVDALRGAAGGGAATEE